MNTASRTAVPSAAVGVAAVAEWRSSIAVRLAFQRSDDLTDRDARRQCHYAANHEHGRKDRVGTLCASGENGASGDGEQAGNDQHVSHVAYTARW